MKLEINIIFVFNGPNWPRKSGFKVILAEQFFVNKKGPPFGPEIRRAIIDGALIGWATQLEGLRY